MQTSDDVANAIFQMLELDSKARSPRIEYQLFARLLATTR